MNHCHDCNSDYEQPGTCNCFAPGGKRAFAPTSVPVYVPVYVPQFVPGNNDPIRTVTVANSGTVPSDTFVPSPNIPFTLTSAPT